MREMLFAVMNVMIIIIIIFNMKLYKCNCISRNNRPALMRRYNARLVNSISRSHPMRIGKCVSL